MGNTMNVTRHACRRVEERSGLAKGNVYNYVRCAYRNGFSSWECDDEVRRYADSLFVKNCKFHGANDSILYKFYKEKVFIFATVRGGCPSLVTMLDLPDWLIGHLPAREKVRKSIAR